MYKYLVVPSSDCHLIAEARLVRAEPGSLEINENLTITEENDMYFGGVCVSGLNNVGVFSYGDKRRGDTSWIN